MILEIEKAERFYELYKHLFFRYNKRKENIKPNICRSEALFCFGIKCMFLISFSFQ